MKDRKKPILIIGVITVIIIIIVGLFIFSRTSDSPAAESVRNFLPFGSGDNSPITDNQFPTTPPGDTDTEPLLSAPEVGLYRIASEPVAGFVVFTRDGATMVRHTDRATGHIYDVNPTTLERIKVTNTTIPKVYEAHFSIDGSKVLYRTLRGDTDTIENLSIALVPPAEQATTTETEVFYTLDTTLLRGGIGEVAAGGADTLYFTLEDNPSIASSNFDGSSLRTLFSSDFTEWRLEPVSNALIAWTKASFYAPGYAYRISSAGSPSKLIGPLGGLVVKPNSSGDKMLYSYQFGNSTKLFARDMASGSEYEIFPTTLAEKCTWSNAIDSLIFCGIPKGGLTSSEPDAWYQGTTRFSDEIWAFDTDTTEGLLLAEPEKDLRTQVDVSSPTISPLEDYLVFINRNDLSLWALRLEE